MSVSNTVEQKIKAFADCEICGAHAWQPHYYGPIRDGVFGQTTPESVMIARCGGCGADRLDESHCHSVEFYADGRYREAVGDTDSVDDYYAKHDHGQVDLLTHVLPSSLRGKIVADVGCGAGAFLDHVSGLVRSSIAIEPMTAYHSSLAERGYKVFSEIQDAVPEHAGTVERIFCFNVIDHPISPRAMLEDMAQLLAPEGEVFILVSNRDVSFFDLVPEVFPSFFYRRFHRWYFDVKSLSKCAELAGLAVVNARYRQLYGFDNMIKWVRDNGPLGTKAVPDLFHDAIFDGVWRKTLENKGRSDYLWLQLGKVGLY